MVHLNSSPNMETMLYFLSLALILDKLETKCNIDQQLQQQIPQLSRLIHGSSSCTVMHRTRYITVHITIGLHHMNNLVFLFQRYKNIIKIKLSEIILLKPLCISINHSCKQKLLLCTGGAYYLTYIFRFISNKFWNWGGGGFYLIAL